MSLRSSIDSHQDRHIGWTWPAISSSSLGRILARFRRFGRQQRLNEWRQTRIGLYCQRRNYWSPFKVLLSGL